MNRNNDISEEKHQKMLRKYEHQIGGIFSSKTRKRILGILGLSGRYRTMAAFWYEVKKYVKTALIDLEIFIERAGKDNVNDVVTHETLKPIVEALLYKPTLEQAEPDRIRAEIAQLFIQQGFHYLSSMKTNLMTKAHFRTIDEATDLVNYLVESFKPES